MAIVDLFNISKIMNDWVANMLRDILTALFNFCFKLLSIFVLNITDLDLVPNLRTFIGYSEMAAQVLATIFLVLQICKQFQSMLSGASDPNYAELLGNFLLSFVLIYATPYIIEHGFIRINNSIITSLVDLEVTVNVISISPLLNILGSIIGSLLFLLFWVISLFIFVLTAAIRYVEIAGLLIIGPLIAATQVNKSDIYRVYWTEVTAVVFTQIFHLLLAYWIFSNISISPTKFLFSLGCIFVAIKGPGWMRQLFYATGSAGAASGVGKLVVYKLLLKR